MCVGGGAEQGKSSENIMLVVGKEEGVGVEIPKTLLTIVKCCGVTKNGKYCFSLQFCYGESCGKIVKSLEDFSPS